MTKEELNAMVAFLQREQRNYNYIDPDDGGLYSEEFIEDFEEFGNQFVEE